MTPKDVIEGVQIVRQVAEIPQTPLAGPSLWDGQELVVGDESEKRARRETVSGRSWFRTEAGTEPEVRRAVESVQIGRAAVWIAVGTQLDLSADEISERLKPLDDPSGQMELMEHREVDGLDGERKVIFPRRAERLRRPALVGHAVSILGMQGDRVAATFDVDSWQDGGEQAGKLLGEDRKLEWAFGRAQKRIQAGLEELGPVTADSGGVSNRQGERWASHGELVVSK